MSWLLCVCDEGGSKVLVVIHAFIAGVHFRVGVYLVVLLFATPFVVAPFGPFVIIGLILSNYVAPCRGFACIEFGVIS